MYTTSDWLADIREELRSMELWQRLAHAGVWLAGLVIVNIPVLGLTIGVFHSDDASLLVPSLYGALLNAGIFYGNVVLIRRWWRRNGRRFWRYSLFLFLVLGLIESGLDAGYYALFYGNFHRELIGEILLGTLLMNGFFFYAPSFVYGVVRAAVPGPVSAPRILVKDGTEEVFLEPEELLYVESDGNYAIFHTRTRKIMERTSLKQVAVQLPAQFVRCHRSFVVNTRLIEKRNYQFVTIEGREIPIGRKYAQELSAVLEAENSG